MSNLLTEWTEKERLQVMAHVRAQETQIMRLEAALDAVRLTLTAASPYSINQEIADALVKRIDAALAGNRGQENENIG